MRRQPATREASRDWTHTCTLQSYSTGAGSNANLGHPDPDTAWSNYATAQPCRLHPESGAREMNIDVRGTVAVVVIHYTLYLPYSATLAGALAPLTYRVTAVTDDAGTVISAGPLSVVFIADPGSLHHHLELALTRQRIQLT